MDDLFSWNTLTSRPSSDDVFNGLGITAAIIFGIIFLVAAVIAVRPQLAPFRRSLHKRDFSRWVNVGLWISGFGLFFLFIRILQIDPLTFGEPIWIMLMLGLLLAWFVWLGVMLSRAHSRRAMARTRYTRSGSVAPPMRRPVRRRRL